ncbi:uroporphyrinogen-III synthase [uncultured Chitinophaga sp.]|jgi:Uroporphyrinogen-III synthase|uniref:uroporphyrinogen-III synthase n=1 Tax=uncultured Chitinophaga sp. TaxID=339340 RepID=UPI002604B430|nr:uroporphyrinogen-III synthase [uncultured Chitinophaga sp.]
MPNERPRILCTRPLSEQLLQEAAAKGLDISVQAFTDIQPLVTKELWATIQLLLSRNINAVFTSAHAVKTLEQHYLPQAAPDIAAGNHWQIYCLEAGTLQAIQATLPASPVKATAANATALANTILAAGNVKEVYFFCGRQRREELPSILSANGVQVYEIILYENVPTPVITGEQYDGIFFFSPSAVTSFFSVNRLPATTVCFAIGATTARTAADLTGNKVIISTAPRAESMVQTAIFYFNNINCYE